MAEFAVVELGAALGMSTMSAKRLVGDVVELAHRLPNVWARVTDYELPAWKCRLIAQRTKALSAEAASFVDVRVAPTAERYSFARLDRLVIEAAAAYDPEPTALADAESAAAHHVAISTRTEPGLGDATNAMPACVEAALDPADALDLESAVAAIATSLLDDEATAHLSLDQRRAKALGVLGRHYTGGQAGGTARVVHLYCHVDEGALQGTGLVRVDNLKAIFPVERLDEWATAPGTVVKPVQVIDLDARITGERHDASGRLREQVQLIAGRTCAFPCCDKPAIAADLDHIEPFKPDDPGGGKTETLNLAPLCRGHHRAKTHGGWDYTQTRPGEYLWRSPHGAVYLRHRGGGTAPLRTHADTLAATG